MTTGVLSESLNLGWDAFLKEEVAKDTPDVSNRSRRLQLTRDAIAAWLQLEWPAIRHELRQKYLWAVPEGLEPHWVAPGRAVLWQEQTVREHGIRTLEDGTREPYAQWLSKGWFPTLPQRVNSAAALAGFLERGLRLRPPREGVDLETLKVAPLPEGPIAPAEESRPFYCNLHPEKGRISFRVWKAYIQHCNRYVEMPDIAQAPPEVLERARQYAWYCFQHNRGFNNRRLALHHVRTELRRPGKAIHITLQDMEVRT